MKNNYFCVEQEDGYITKVYYYPSTGDTIASILLLHGMAEHHGRYEDFIKYMVQIGFSIFTYDHRGHGTDKRIEELGFFSPKKGYEKVVKDAVKVFSKAKSQDSSGKFYIMGHSMGSLILRNVIQHRDDMDGIILCGTTYPSPVATNIGLLLSHSMAVVKGVKHRSPFLNNILFGGRAYSKYCRHTPFDWLTNDAKTVAAYIQDPYCGFICSSSFYSDLIKLSSLAGRKERMQKTRRELPMFIISGKEDPVSKNGKEVQKLSAFYTSSHYQNVTAKLYSGCRHELLNELNKDVIYSDISAWINNQLSIPK